MAYSIQHTPWRVRIDFAYFTRCNDEAVKTINLIFPTGRSKTVKRYMARYAKLKRVNEETAQFFGITIEKRRLKITEKSVTKAKEALKDPDHLTDEIKDIYRQILSTHENGNSVNVNKLAAQFKKLTLSKLKKVRLGAG